jgi:hypothetical protein
MTELVEGNQGNQPGSQGGSQSNSADPEMPQWAKDLQSQVAEIAGQQRALQSGKDRRFERLENQVAEAQSTFAQAFEYAQSFQDPKEAERAWFIDQQIAAQQQGYREQAQAGQNYGPAGNETEVVPGDVDPSLLQSYGVDPTSAEYLNHIRAGKSGMEAALAIVAKRNAGNPEGSATGASGGTGGTTTSQTTQQAVLKEQYEAELDQAAKLTHGVLKPNDLYRIQVKYAGLGLQGLGIQ